ncbi:MAG: hypothetical protein N4A72_16910 [Bacteroidales bacterium]|jgi:hypothetical protein|nr:hypothetical protein [Bacteroidales bacterium]
MRKLELILVLSSLLVIALKQIIDKFPANIVVVTVSLLAVLYMFAANELFRNKEFKTIFSNNRYGSDSVGKIRFIKGAGFSIGFALAGVQFYIMNWGIFNMLVAGFVILGIFGVISAIWYKKSNDVVYINIVNRVIPVTIAVSVCIILTLVSGADNRCNITDEAEANKESRTIFKAVNELDSLGNIKGNYLITGWYKISDSETRFKRYITNDSAKAFYIDPKPILTIYNIKGVSYTGKRNCVDILLDKRGSELFNTGTEENLDKRICFVWNDNLLYAPVVNAVIETELLNFYVNTNCIYPVDSIVNTIKKDIKDIRG